jgi:hypothetical protein
MRAITVVPGQQKGTPFWPGIMGSLDRGSETPVRGPRIAAAAPEEMLTLGLSIPEGT